MNENEIVLSLLDFYKQKGIDLYRVLDDPTFKALSLQTRLDAIKHYAQMIHDDTPHGIAKRDFREGLRSLFVQAGLGAVTGALASAGTAVTFNKGKISPGAPILGAMVGGMSGAITSAFSTASRRRDRMIMNQHIKDVIDNPTNENALRYLTANNVRSTLTESGNKILNKIQEKVDAGVNADLDAKFKAETVAFNRDLGNEPK
jgi:uncharacterized membrane protein